MGKYRTPEKPKGMASFCNEVEKICSLSDGYKHCGTKIPNYIFMLDKGEGRKTAIRYAAEMFEDKGLLDTSSSPEKLIYITYDGTSANYYDNKRKINNAAVYKNKYTGLIGCEPIALAECQNADFYELFIHDIEEISSYATLFFFVDKFTSEEEDKFISRLSSLCNARLIHVENYKPSDLVEICEDRILKFNINIDNKENVHDVLLRMIIKMKIDNPKDAVMLARSMIELVDFSVPKPTLKYSRLKSIADSYCK